MIAYHKTLGQFYHDVRTNRIEDEIVAAMGRDVGESERRSFNNSLPRIKDVLELCNLPEDVEVALEYRIPLTDRRVDFMIAGSDENGVDHLIICELKQWDRVEHTDMPDVVMVGKQPKVHPSWQAYSYGSALSNFNEYVEEGCVEIETCTFIHNYDPRFVDELRDPVYAEGISRAEPFIKNQFEDLARFISKYIKTRSSNDILFEMENGHIRPSKLLADSIANILNGNSEYELLDEQRVVYSLLKRIIRKVTSSSDRDKHVIIVRGGAGTGKSLIAIQLMASLISEGRKKAFYVAKSSYVKENYFNKLTRGVPNYQYLRTLFKGSGSFIDSINNEFDVLIVDEAHRLMERTKQSWYYKGENQIREIIHASKVSVFFIDETQNIDIKDFGTVENIIDAALSENAVIHKGGEFVLRSQFRCKGSDEYIAWLEAVLYNKEYNPSGEVVDYDIRICDDICSLKDEIGEINEYSAVPSRMLSGDVFEWKSMKNKDAIDIEIGDFKAQWNRTKKFATDSKSIDEVGCIHTSQGMEFEYVGLIIGNDLLYRDGKVVTDYTVHPKNAGEFKRPSKRCVDPNDAEIIDRLIRNTYKVLFTRGQKGCLLYVMDEPLREYLRQCIRGLRSQRGRGLITN